MNFTAREWICHEFFRHRIIAVAGDQLSWVKPWWPSSKTIVPGVTSVFCTARLKPFFPFRLIHQAGPILNGLWWSLSNAALVVFPALVPVQRMRFMKWLCLPMQRFHPSSSTAMDPQRHLLFDGKKGPRAGPDVFSVERNLFLYTQCAPTQ